MSTSALAERTSAGDRHKHLMNRIYRVQRHFYDATRAYYLLGRDQLVMQLAPPAGGTVLELGCGTGRNLVQVARTYGSISLYGADISDAMLATAGKAIERNGLLGRVRLAQGDAVNFNGSHSFGVAQFDRVYFSYTLSMIPDWQGAIQNALSLLRPDGELHIVDFGGCEALPSTFRRTLYTWLEQFHVEPRMALEQVSHELASLHQLALKYTPSHRGYAQHVTLKRQS